MHTTVANRINSFNAQFEGRFHHMYRDSKNLVTVGVGNLLATREVICDGLYPFTHGLDGLPASCEDRQVAWDRIKEVQPDPHRGETTVPDRNGNDIYARATDLRLNDTAIDNLVQQKARQFDNVNRVDFLLADYENFPADAQLGLLSMRWAGVDKPAMNWGRFPQFHQHVLARRWFAAARECHFNEMGNLGLRPRNDANRWLFSLAGRVAAMGLNPTLLYFDNKGAHKAYFFRDGQYVRYDWDDNRLDFDKPRALSAWNLPVPFLSGVDAVVNGSGERKVPNFFGKTYFFKGPEYVRYDWDTGRVDYGPQPLTAWGLTGAFASGIDAAVNGEGAWFGKLYFFKGNQYVRYDWATETIDQGETSIASGWKVPEPFASGIDAAVSGEGPWKGKLYFFKGSSYIRCRWGKKRQGGDAYKVDGRETTIAGPWGGLAKIDFARNISASVNPPGRS